MEKDIKPKILINKMTGEDDDYYYVDFDLEDLEDDVIRSHNQSEEQIEEE